VSVGSPRGSRQPSGYAQILGRLLVDLDLRAGLVPDAKLAALCIEHGLTMVSADSDFARFTDITWFNPMALRAFRRSWTAATDSPATNRQADERWSYRSRAVSISFQALAASYAHGLN